MKSVTTEQFRWLYAKAPRERQLRIRRAYSLWSVVPKDPSLRFKKAHDALAIYSARVDLDWRAVCVLGDDTVVGFWVGSHQQYEELLRSLRKLVHPVERARQEDNGRVGTPSLEPMAVEKTVHKYLPQLVSRWPEGVAGRQRFLAHCGPGVGAIRVATGQAAAG